MSNCDRGILLTGTNEIIPNGFQLAAKLEDALALPPVFIPLNVQLTLFTSEPGVGPFDAFVFNLTAHDSQHQYLHKGKLRNQIHQEMPAMP